MFLMKKTRTSSIYVNPGPSKHELAMDVDGITRTDRLVIIDTVDGKEWELLIKDGKISIEPFELSEKRDFKIKKVLKSSVSIGEWLLSKIKNR